MKILNLTYEDKALKWSLEKANFEKLTLLVGASGVGKTQILNSIMKLKAIADGKSISGIKWNIEFVTLERKKRTQRLIELGALFDIANLGHHDPATLVGMLTNISTAVAPDDHKWPKWHQQGVSILLERKQAKNTKYGDSE